MRPSPSSVELLPQTSPVPATTVEDAAALAERFYDLFSDVPPRGPRDLEYFRSLLGDFSADLDLVEELKRFQAWSLDKGASAGQYPRSRFRDWLARARQYKNHRRERAEH